MLSSSSFLAKGSSALGGSSLFCMEFEGGRSSWVGWGGGVFDSNSGEEKSEVGGEGFWGSGSWLCGIL